MTRGSLLSRAVGLIGLAASLAAIPRTGAPQNAKSPPLGRAQMAVPPGTPVIRVRAPSVVVDVIVTDKKGHPVRGLTANDFQLFENNAEQKIVTFVPPLAAEAGSTVEAPKPAAAPPPAPSAPATPPKPGEREARDLASVHFITLVLDLGDLQPGHIKHACDAASAYIHKDVAADDFIAIYWLDQSLHLALAFTQNKQEALVSLARLSAQAPGGRLTTQERIETEQEIQSLNQAINGFEAYAPLGVGTTPTAPGNGPASGGGAGGTAAGAQAAEVQMEKMELATLMKFLWSQTTLQARAVLVALRAIAQAYQSLPGRKNVVVFSEGFLHSPEVQPEIQAVVDAANRANVAFYVIDASGLAAEYYDAANATPPDPSGTREAYRVANWGQYDQVSTGLHKFDWSAHLRGIDSTHEDLGQVALATGGLMMKNQNDLLAGLESVDRDLREFYTLVYQPTNTNYDGSFRHIKVEALQPGLHVRYRQGYWAIPPGEEVMMTPAAAQLLAAIENGSLRPAFAPDVNAALLFAPDGRIVAPVRVMLPAKSVALERDGERYRGSATLVLVARDRTGRPVSVHQRFLSFDLTKKEYDEFRSKNLDISARLALPDLEPVTVEGVIELPQGTVALGNCEVRLPDSGSAAAPPQGLGPALTSLVLSNDIQPAQGAPDPADPLRGEGFQINLPATARFSRADKLTLYFGILRREATDPPQRFSVAYSIKSGANVVAKPPAEELAWNPSQDRLLVLKQFDLNRLAPGPYTMEVTVETAVTHILASTSARFSVE